MAIALTQNAARHVLDYAESRRAPFVGLRLSVKPSGCSGLAYLLELAADRREGDVLFESNGVTILTDPKSLVHVDGTVLDYVREGVQEGFRFDNPNVKSACGCGESFTT